ncbi:protein translocase subunit SecF [Emcibacter nanhaiensis]|uniref:Protein-export membrane protein SecF n=1 Tax=Emcibacter nanhaiensis TaxID=1505037 RepID=A0A501PTR8_9PROT|nr:protein translocase subunit SecF [Emcibacter nanhaiensis]TPD63121.1 protein translocase subunit SecF [Emcibacter nanhaiensis]
MLLKLVPDNTNIKFVNYRKAAFALSLSMLVASVILFFTHGLNFGIDFKGGVLMEVKTEQTADLAAIRESVGSLGMGTPVVQEFGDPTDVLIRLEYQQDKSLEQIVEEVKATLDKTVEGEVSFRRTETVGPKVSGELIEDGVLSVTLAVLAVLVYIWFRFEWQFGLGAVIALIHDVCLTIGLFCFIEMEFNLSIIAAILTIVGYSLNDTVVVYDRVRENLRKYRKMDMLELLNLSLNETLSRTTMTSFTTLLALGALFYFGGENIHGFTAAMIWGIFVGTYSSIFIACPVLMWFEMRREPDNEIPEGMEVLPPEKG